MQPHLSRWTYFTSIQMPAARVLWKAEREGLRIDPEERLRCKLRQLKAASLEARHIGEISTVEKAMAKEERWELNLASTQQMRWLLYDTLSLPKQRKLKTKAVTVDANAIHRLHALKHMSKDARMALHYLMQNMRLKADLATYITSLRPAHSRIHPSYALYRSPNGEISVAGSTLDWPHQMRSWVIPEAHKVFVAGTWTEGVDPDPDAAMKAYRQHRLDSPWGWRRWFFSPRPDKSAAEGFYQAATHADMLKIRLAQLAVYAEGLGGRVATVAPRQIVCEVPESAAAEMADKVGWVMGLKFSALGGRSFAVSVKSGPSWQSVS
jgi:hypothetical protein